MPKAAKAEPQSVSGEPVIPEDPMATAAGRAEAYPNVGVTSDVPEGWDEDEPEEAAPAASTPTQTTTIKTE